MDLSARITVLGIGNVLMQDDGVGCWAVQALASHYRFDPPVALIEGGTNLLSLSAWLTEVEHLIVVDAVEAERAPGTMVFFELSPGERCPWPASAHQLGIKEVLHYALWQEKKVPEVVVCGIQPFNAFQPGLALTSDMQKCLPHLVEAVVKYLRRLGVTCQPKPA